jgi:hypothetical protein
MCTCKKRAVAASRQWARDAHPFFWVITAALAAAAFVAVRTKGDDPGYAFHSELIYRCEVGLACLIAFYSIVLLLWLAYQGRSVKVHMGPGSVEGGDPGEGLEEAATAFDEFKDDTTQRLDTYDESFESLDARVSALEEAAMPSRARQALRIRRQTR